MPFILETVVATRNPDGSHHVAPYGLIRDDAGWILAPFRPSPAIDNLHRHPFAVASGPTDMRVVAGHVTGRRDWPLVPADRVEGVRLADCFGHIELEVIDFTDDATRPRFRCRIVHEVAHRPFSGFNRAQAAVLEAAILSTRLGMLPRDKVETEMAYLEIAVSKTAGPAEREAWDWIRQKIEGHFAAPLAATDASTH
ncbi:DUF447 domain-containing protein [Prosthecomicrobium hirschii]|uniref:DUF447 domain-containing protein n=1 Tax=Prosthecodimorpha hirschii TaxID=665126 RepID=UPI0022203908|nr:DUF447 domain-containing protein [Prosthecomicrobium hirschii]MCW1843261.1 DUF447 family protein [Prosthecomicrobium hirschii]